MRYAERTRVGYMTETVDGDREYRYFEPVEDEGTSQRDMRLVHGAVLDQGRVDPFLGGGKGDEPQVHPSRPPRENAHQPGPPNFYDRAEAAPRFHARPSEAKDAQSLSRGRVEETARARIRHIMRK